MQSVKRIKMGETRTAPLPGTRIGSTVPLFPALIIHRKHGIIRNEKNGIRGVRLRRQHACLLQVGDGARPGPRSM